MRVESVALSRSATSASPDLARVHHVPGHERLDPVADRDLAGQVGLQPDARIALHPGQYLLHVLRLHDGDLGRLRQVDAEGIAA